MCEQQQLTRLIADIYDAALDAAQWSGVLAGIADFADGQAGGLLVKDCIKKNVSAHYHSGVDPHYMQLYSDTYSKCGPIATSLFGNVEQIASVPDLVCYDQFCRGCFYREWAKPQGWADVAIACLEKSASCCAYLNIARDKTGGMVDSEMRQRLALLVPHVRRAVLIGKAMEFKQAEAATFADVFDGLSAGLFLIDAEGRIVHANRAGDDILDSCDVLRSVGGRLAANDVRVDQVLRDAATAAAGGDAALGSAGITLSLVARDGVSYVVHVLSLGGGERRRVGMAYTATAALFVRKAALEGPPSPQAISDAFELTPAELRVLFGIVDIGGVPEVADAFGVAESTIKTHLRRLFEKTGTGRQAELVKLVAGFSTPLAH